MTDLQQAIVDLSAHIYACENALKVAKAIDEQAGDIKTRTCANGPTVESVIEKARKV